MQIDSETEKRIELASQEIYDQTHDLRGDNVPGRFKAIVKLYIRAVIQQIKVK
jgi:hypothetical protein